MKLKFKLVSAACVALCSAGAFAATAPTACVKTSLDTLLNTCVPEVTFYMGGATAQQGAVNTVLTTGTGVFDLTLPRGQVYNAAAGTTSGLSVANAADITKSNTVGYIGIGAASTPAAGKVVLVIYNKANGSNAGVQQLLKGPKPFNEGTTLKTFTLADQKLGNKGTNCAVVTESVAGSLGKASCTAEAQFSLGWSADKQKVMHLALSDTSPAEATPGGLALAGKDIAWKDSVNPSVTTAMQGFGVMVNPALYTALIAKQVADGDLAASCLNEDVTAATHVVTAACQPNMTKALYASIAHGKVTSVEALLGTAQAGKKINLARRVITSGTQSASDLFFLNRAGNNAKVKAPAVDTFLNPVIAGIYGDLVVTEGGGTGDVITAVNAATDYALGVVSLENTYAFASGTSKLKGSLFVKIDGVSPNMTTAGVDSKHRVGLLKGYPFAIEMKAIKAASKYYVGAYADIGDKLIAGLGDPTVNLSGIAYIGSADATKNTSFTRNKDNFNPLTK